MIHETATIDQPCEIGEETKIWHYSHVMAGAKIGSHCQLGQSVFVDKNAVIGDRCKIQNNVSVYNSVIIEDDVFLGPSCVFTNVTNPRSFVERKDEFKKTHVKEGATIGANATIVCGVTVGRYALVGAGAVITKDVPDFGLVYGNPARLRGWACKCGIKLPSDFDEAVCPECTQTYVMKEDRVNFK